jgi:hypothetical protein
MPGRRLRGGYRCGCGHSECLPVGYLIIAFPGDSEATSAREALLTGADEDDEVVTFDREQVMSDIENSRDTISPFAYLGAELGHQRQQLE